MRLALRNPSFPAFSLAPFIDVRFPDGIAQLDSAVRLFQSREHGQATTACEVQGGIFPMWFLQAPLQPSGSLDSTCSVPYKRKTIYMRRV